MWRNEYVEVVAFLVFLALVVFLSGVMLYGLYHLGLDIYEFLSQENVT